jgi:hypothetical protein
VRKARHRELMQATHVIRHMRSLVVSEDEYGAHKVFTIEDNQKPSHFTIYKINLLHNFRLNSARKIFGFQI